MDGSCCLHSNLGTVCALTVVNQGLAEFSNSHLPDWAEKSPKTQELLEKLGDTFVAGRLTG